MDQKTWDALLGKGDGVNQAASSDETETVLGAVAAAIQSEHWEAAILICDELTCRVPIWPEPGGGSSTRLSPAPLSRGEPDCPVTGVGEFGMGCQLDAAFSGADGPHSAKSQTNVASNRLSKFVG